MVSGKGQDVGYASGEAPFANLLTQNQKNDIGDLRT